MLRGPPTHRCSSAGLAPGALWGLAHSGGCQATPTSQDWNPTLQEASVYMARSFQAGFQVVPRSQPPSCSHTTPSAGWASGWALHRRPLHTTPPRFYFRKTNTTAPHTATSRHAPRSNTGTYWSRRVRSKSILRAAGLRSAAGGRVPPHSRPPGNYGNGGEPAPRRKGGACESKQGAHPRSEPLRPLPSPPGLSHNTPTQDPTPQL